MRGEKEVAFTLSVHQRAIAMQMTPVFSETSGVHASVATEMGTSGRASRVTP